ncbi:cupredoxin domain-containing protein [Streptomyces sp. NPDC044571]|uniref:cupredoxin domain-containing protein n=1 Tax=Streptomyces sp. NPDC044571 TaxID=3155371 RepID=UPI0033C68AC4
MAGTKTGTAGTARARNRAGLALAAGALAAGLLGACGDGSATSTTAPPPAGGSMVAAATRVEADLSDFHIGLSQKAFKAGPYTFVVKNTGHHEHALEIEGPGGEQRSKTLAPGESDHLDITLKSGRYEFYCPVDGHKDLGMESEITVTGAS